MLLVTKLASKISFINPRIHTQCITLSSTIFMDLKQLLGWWMDVKLLFLDGIPSIQFDLKTWLLVSVYLIETYSAHLLSLKYYEFKTLVHIDLIDCKLAVFGSKCFHFEVYVGLLFPCWLTTTTIEHKLVVLC
jgi:hypothetical protein